MKRGTQIRYSYNLYNIIYSIKHSPFCIKKNLKNIFIYSKNYWRFVKRWVHTKNEWTILELTKTKLAFQITQGTEVLLFRGRYL